MEDLFELDELIVKTLVLGMCATNCYVIANKDTREAVIVDPADSADRILAYLEKEACKPAAVLLTHGHFDHIYGVNELRKEYGIMAYASREEKELLGNGEMNCSKGAGRLEEILADSQLEDGQKLSFLGCTFRVIHTPGHTRGSVCYLIEEKGLLFSGDTLFFESIGRTDLPTGNGHAILQSIGEKLMTLKDDIVVFPGHGPKTAIGYEKRNNPFFN